MHAAVSAAVPAGLAAVAAAHPVALPVGGGAPVRAVATAVAAVTPAVLPRAEPQREPMTFEDIYAAHFDFVWRSVRRLGVPPGSVDDAVQDAFMVVHRRLAEFEGRSSVKTWLFGIVRRVVRDHRPRAGRADTAAAAELPDVADVHAPSPLESLERAEAARLMHALLDTLDDDKREAFVLAELEQMTVPEVAEALGVNVNTVYSRVRAAKRELEQALTRVRARAGWRERCAI